jgi:F-box protein 18 (helicase)
MLTQAAVPVLLPQTAGKRNGNIMTNSAVPFLTFHPDPFSFMQPHQRSTFKLTAEQEAILQSTGNIKINAVAGSGKTTTIIQYAATRPAGSRILYLAFNKTVKGEAKKKFTAQGLHNVQVETAHSLAYKAIVIGSAYTVRPQGYSTFEIAQLLGLADHGEKHGAYIFANHIAKFLSLFCNSTAQKVQDLNYLDTVVDQKAKAFVKTFYKYIVDGTRLLLKRMHAAEIDITHDFYLKLYQLSNPILPCDYILFDEGQDASPAMLDVFLKQPATKVIVGDAHQQIYSWRHAVNSLEKADFATYQLSTSFRFNQEIADLGSAIVHWKNHLQKQEPVGITGSGLPAATGTKATLARTNLGLLLRAITYITEHKDVQHLYFEGNINSYVYADEGASLYDVLNLYNGRHDGIRNTLLQTMKSMEDLEDYIEKTEDVQLRMMVEIVNEYGNAIPGLIRELKSKHVGDTEKEQAEMIFSTVHRCKGMEYGAVQLVEDFITEATLEKAKAQQEELKANLVKLNEEINLLYVAVTRTRGLLRIPESLMPKGFPACAMIHVLKPKTEASQKGEGSSNKSKPTKYQKEMPRTYAEIRLAHKNAYEHWTPERDDELRAMFHQGRKLALIAAHFGRKQGAIVSRLRKLGCINAE